jgi:hypothetical protein
MEQIKENVAIKRELNRFMNRFFYNKEKTTENLAEMYYYLDDFMNFVSKLQEDIGNELLKKEDFNSVFLEKEGIKVFLDEELGTILIDALSERDRKVIEKRQNEAYIKSLHIKK